MSKFEQPIVDNAFAKLQDFVVSFQPDKDIFMNKKSPIKVTGNKRENEVGGESCGGPNSIGQRPR